MSTIHDPLHLPCGARLSNRLAKAAVTEGLADERGWPTADLVRLYEGWSDAGFALLISGNVIVDGAHLERPGNIVIDHTLSDPGHLQALQGWTQAATRGGAHFWAQLSHSGRQTPKSVNARPLSVSDVRMGLPKALFGEPRAMKDVEIHDVVENFAAAAATCKAAGFTGVQIHAAHGYLLGTFLAPKVNNRADKWGGSLANRARLLLDVVAGVRARVGRMFPVSVKLNSADFQRGGFEARDCLVVGKWLEAAGVDLLEISGGSYENPVMLGASGAGADCEPRRKASTVEREAYFLDFARTMRQELKMPIMLTGGLRSRQGMQAALDEGVDVLGIARPACVDQQCGKALLAGQIDRFESWEANLRREKGLFSPNSPIPLLGVLANFAGIFWFYAQINRLAKGTAPSLRLSPLRGLIEIMLADRANLARRGRWLKDRAPIGEATPKGVSRKKAA